MLTRVFKSGNSLAVRIPKEMAFISASDDVEIERQGDALVLRPVRSPSLDDLDEVLALFGPGFMAQGREEAPEVDRPWPQVERARRDR